ncbi:MAG: hypothetical protein EOO00_04965 [Chitinophagaceae bacterium]|nr:MAG: hypothetical protein EOO00_04965 [Chitinophagaceae bacterium]
MKKLILITSLITILVACGHEYRAIGDAPSIANIQDENQVLNYEVSLGADKKVKHPGTHSSCRNYHKKTYE